jgi:MFS transporter, FSR family, fosmidomycin resistance protein
VTRGRADIRNARKRSNTLSARTPLPAGNLSQWKPSSEGFRVSMGSLGHVDFLPAGVDRRAMAALSSGHLVTDLAQGSLPAFLPFLVDEFGLTYTMAAALVLAGTFASSIIQPLFGLWSDARGALWLLPAGVAIAGVGMGAAALAPSYPLVVLAVVVSGLGVAAYHPEGSKFASYVSGGRRASGMAFFSVGGNVGFALGPLVASFVIITLGLGLEGGALVAIPGLIVCVFLFAVRDYLASFAPEDAVGADRRRVPSQRGGMAVLLSVVGLRSVAHMGLFTFVPLYEVSRGNSIEYGIRLLSLFLLAGAVGTLLGGPLADRFGRRPVMRYSFAIAAPLIAVYAVVGGALGAAALIVSGAALVGTFGVSLVMSQEYMPSRVGLASGLSIGMAIGLGGIAAVCLGGLADVVNIETAVLATALGPAIAFVLTFALPQARSRVVRGEPAAAAI